MLLITKKKEENLILYNKFNTTHKYVTFAKECECKYEIFFLDAVVIKRDSKVLTKALIYATITSLYFNLFII